MHKLRPFLYSLLGIVCLSVLLWARPLNTIAAVRPSGGDIPMPRQCRPGKTSTEALGWRWRPGVSVRVYYLKSNFSAAEMEALTRAVRSWNAALKEIDSQIVFRIGGERDSVAEDHASITVMRGIPRGRDRVGEIKHYALSNGVDYMLVIINPEITDPDALTSLMTHEIGHSLGLADCYKCQRGTTAMAAFRDNNKGNDVYEPSECDKYVVAAGYASESAAHARRFD